MFDNWRKNIAENLELVRQNAGPTLAIIVSGNEKDRKYWQEHLMEVRRDVFRQDGRTFINSVREGTRKGNCLGTFNAWLDTQAALADSDQELSEITLMSMVFGKGTRLSPFTQALGNRKPAFVTPMKATQADGYLCTADLSGLYSNLWIKQLRENGFRGLVVKWGDEAIIPGQRWSDEAQDYSQVDAIRFIWQTEVTETFARQKEWVAFEGQTGLMKYQYARQEMDSLKNRLAELEGGNNLVGVNLGSLALSYDFLEVAAEILKDDIADPDIWVDWDPYVWMALFCRSEAEWQAEKEHEERLGIDGIRELEALYPDFYAKITRVRETLESRTGRPLAVKVLDFGEAFWVDIGLHETLRETLEALAAETERGTVTRELLGLPHDRDEKGNIIVRSQVPAGADIRGSVIVDSVILDEETIIQNGVVVGGRHRSIEMPEGGSALFCAVGRLVFGGPQAIAFRLTGPGFELPAGARYTTLLLPGGPELLVANESIEDLKAVYSEPILDNSLSFEEAGRRMAQLDGLELDRKWTKIRREWLQ